MVKLVLIRPGSTDYNKQGRIQGTLDVPLSAEGSAEVDAALAELEALDMGTIYFAPCQAAEETANRIADSAGLKVKKAEQLCNLDHGLWQGMLVDEVKRKHPKIYKQWQDHPDSICPPEGETVSSARARIQTGINKLLKRHKKGVIGLVVPEPLASLVVGYLEHQAVGDLWKATALSGGWQMIEVEPQTLAATYCARSTLQRKHHHEDTHSSRTIAKRSAEHCRRVHCAALDDSGWGSSVARRDGSLRPH